MDRTASRRNKGLGVAANPAPRLPASADLFAASGSADDLLPFRRRHRGERIKFAALSDVPSTRSRSEPSRFARVASSLTDLGDFPLLAAVSAIKLSGKVANFAALPPLPPVFPGALPCPVSGCAFWYAPLRCAVSFARCAGVRSRRIRFSSISASARQRSTAVARCFRQDASYPSRPE